MLFGALKLLYLIQEKKKRKVVLGGCFIVEVCVSTMSYSTCYSLKEVKSSLPIKVLREVF